MQHSKGGSEISLLILVVIGAMLFSGLFYTLDDNSLTKDAAHIYDDQNKEVLFIYTYAAGERTPVGNLTIDGVPFTINYFKDIQCLADLDATNWVPGTKPLFGIHIRCDKANQEQLDQYKTIIQSITFSPALKNILLGNVHN